MKERGKGSVVRDFQRLIGAFLSAIVATVTALVISKIVAERGTLHFWKSANEAELRNMVPPEPGKSLPSITWENSNVLHLKIGYDIYNSYNMKKTLRRFRVISKKGKLLSTNNYRFVNGQRHDTASLEPKGFCRVFLETYSDGTAFQEIQRTDPTLFLSYKDEMDRRGRVEIGTIRHRFQKTTDDKGENVMNVPPEVLSLLCDPLTHESLHLTDQGRTLTALSGRRFPISSDFPVLLENNDTLGKNAKYQTLYDRMAFLYDFAIIFYAWLKGGSIEKRRQDYLDELEVREGSRVLEVSVGTGQNLRFLPTKATYFGLDISMGMLRRCQRNLKRWKRQAALLVQGAAEHLPFVDRAFDSVLHMGGINFFNDKAQALREMVRVAKPGTKIVIVDETEKVTKRYERTPIVGSFYRNQHSSANAPVDCLPSGVKEVQVKTIANGELYCLSFRCPV